MREVWRDIPDYEGLYKVSNLGRVKGVERTVRGPKNSYRVRPEMVMRTRPHKGGYRHIILSKEDKKQGFLVHSLVCMAFKGPRPFGKHASHKNGKPADNRTQNLRWATPKENNADKRRHGTHLSGERTPAAKLTQKQVDVIRTLEGKMRQADIAARFGVSASQVSAIFRGKTWAGKPCCR